MGAIDHAAAGHAAADMPVDGAPYDEITVFADLGVRALVTTRSAGSFGTASDEPVGVVMARWERLRESLGAAGQRFATASQVHGARIIEHAAGWTGWLRGDGADGHLLVQRPMSAAVVVADCVPVFVVHPSGAAALLHAGWRGTAAGILPAAVRRLAALGHLAPDLRVHTGPAICGDCYEVGADVAAILTGRQSDGPARVDLRAILADQARALGVTAISSSDDCTRCGSHRFFSHRAGDRQRQLGVLATPG
ncbi:MAG: polyphenol oxidase family protein [Gemmatimonadaceae bacterium]